MEKNLPKVYQNPINKEINNNKDVFYGPNNYVRSVSKVNISEKINHIFASVHHVYKSKVRIKTLNDEFETIIVGRTTFDLLTLNGEKINISEIENIERI